MRTFEYHRLPRSLFGGDVLEACAQIYEDKGRFAALAQGDDAALRALQERARFDNVDASLRIEGLYADPARIRAVLAGEEPASELEQQAAGYARALDLIEGEGCGGALPEFSPATILALYETLFSHRNLGRKSRYRKKDYMYVQVDGRPQAMPVSPITAFETPLVLGGACDSLAEALAAGASSPLVLAAVFAVDFLCIRPFDEGNGRLARLASELLLAQAGFDVFRYASIDRIIERSGMAYYDALNACVEGWDRAANDYAPYVKYWLDAVHATYEQLFRSLDAAGGAGGAGGKTARVRAFVRQAADPVTKRQIRAALPDVSEATVEAALGALVREGEAEKLGAGRATAYRWKGEA